MCVCVCVHEDRRTANGTQRQTHCSSRYIGVVGLRFEKQFLTRPPEAVKAGANVLLILPITFLFFFFLHWLNVLTWSTASLPYWFLPMRKSHLSLPPAGQTRVLSPCLFSRTPVSRFLFLSLANTRTDTHAHAHRSTNTQQQLFNGPAATVETVNTDLVSKYWWTWPHSVILYKHANMISLGWHKS